jgi:hypothetical protein
MARSPRSRDSIDRQLSFDDWLRAIQADAASPDTRNVAAPAMDALADALARRLAQRLTDLPSTPAATTARRQLLTLDDLVEELPPAKRPQTWKRWLYERTRRGEIPGCVKLGGMLFFEREPALAWLRAGATAAK